MAIDIDSLQIEIEATSDEAASAIDRLSASLRRLQGNTKQTGLEKTNEQIKGLAKAPSILKLERELKAVERQAIKDGDSLLKLQEELEMLQTFKGVGNPLTVADTDAKIKETTAEIEKLSAVIDNANLKTLQLKASIREAASNTAGKFQKTAQKIKETAPAIDNVSRATKNVEKNFDSASKSAQKLGETVQKAGKNGAGGMGYLARSIKGMALNFALFGVFFSLTSGVGESLSQAAKESESANRTLSEITSSLQYVSDALAAVILPVLQAIQPLVTAILDGLANAMNFLARIIAFFTGQKNVVQAVKQQKDYAKSLEETASAAKEALKYLLPIDELNIFNDSSSSGGNVSTGGLRFETIDTEDFNIPQKIASPEWSPNPIKAPEFAPIRLPEWTKAALPVPKWEKNPLPSFDISVEPAKASLVRLENQLASTWERVKAETTEGVRWTELELGELQTSIEGTAQKAENTTNETLGRLKGSVDLFSENTKANLSNWEGAVNRNFESVGSYVQTVIPSSLTASANSFNSFFDGTSTNTVAWGENLGSNMQNIMTYFPEVIRAGLSSAASATKSWIDGTSSNFAGWGENMANIAGETGAGIFENLMSALSEAWKGFTSFMKAIGEKVSSAWSKSTSFYGKVKNISPPSYTASSIFFGGGLALPAMGALSVPSLLSVPALARGGVLTEPTTILAGEYPGARANPEIVTPKNLMYDTFREAQNTDGVINAIMAGVQQIVRAIEENGGNIYVESDGTVTQNRRNRMYGKTLQRI